MFIIKESINNLADIFKLSARLNEPVIFPTDTIYGIGAPLSNETANTKIYTIKERDINKPLPVLAGNIEQADTIADFSSLNSKSLLFFRENYQNYTTFILKSRINNNSINQKIAVRIPNKKILADALIKFGEPVTATSVNKSGMESLNEINKIILEFNNINLFAYGITNLNKNSSIYDISENDIVKIR